MTKDSHMTTNRGFQGPALPGSTVAWLPTKLIRYQDPNAPKVPPASVIPSCRVCGHVFLSAGRLDDTGACKGKVNCAERASWTGE